MRLESIQGVTVPSIDSNVPPYAFRRIPQGMPKLHMLSAIIGGRGSGKTTSVLKLLKMYVASKSYDKIFWYSPTARREDKMTAFVRFCKSHEVDVELIDTYTDAQFNQTQEWMGKEIDEYKRYAKRLGAWQRFQRVKNTDELSYEDLLLLEEMQWTKPTTTYKHGYPCFAIVLDDQAGKKDVFAASCKNVMSNFMILHRHLSCSVFCLMQIVGNGIPRQIRANISLWMLFACKSKTLQKAVAEEIAFKIHPDELMAAWDFATEGSPHDFLLVDYDEPDRAKMFRKGFDKRLVIEDTSTTAAVS